MGNGTIDTATLLSVYGYTIEGLVFGVANLLIGLSVLKYSALRHTNQYVLLMALALADAANMFGYLAAGIYWFWVIETDRLATLLTPMECLLKPHRFFWMTAYPFSALMLVILSCDRLFMVSFPSVYILSLPSPKYANLFVFGGLFFICLMAVPGLVHVLTMPNERSQDPFCYTIPLFRTHPSLLGDIFLYHYEHTAHLAFASVLIFAAVPVVQKLTTTSELSLAEEQSQNRMTKTVATSCICTLFLFCIPDRLGYVAWYSGWTTLAWSLWLLSLTNPAANIVIYELRHHEMRLALKALLKGKIMPASLGVWPKPYQAVAREHAFQVAAHPIVGRDAQPVEQLQIDVLE